jgi:general secretion pathway protein G
MFSKFAVRRRGFTLIELMIVIVVIAILALIVIPQVAGAGRKAKESTLKTNLQILRGAIAQFQGDTGYYPAALGDLVTATAPANGVDSAAASKAIVAADFKGPYITPQGGINGTGLPKNPFTTTTVLSDHWTYSVASGKVGWINCAVTGTTLDGDNFSNL